MNWAEAGWIFSFAFFDQYQACPKILNPKPLTSSALSHSILADCEGKAAQIPEDPKTNKITGTVDVNSDEWAPKYHRI